MELMKEKTDNFDKCHNERQGHTMGEGDRGSKQRNREPT